MLEWRDISGKYNLADYLSGDLMPRLPIKPVGNYKVCIRSYSSGVGEANFNKRRICCLINTCEIGAKYCASMLFTGEPIGTLMYFAFFNFNTIGRVSNK